MRRRIGQARVLLRTALRGLQTSPGPAVLAVLTIAMALVLGGAFALVVANMRGLLDRAGSDLQVVAYLEHGISEQRVRELLERTAAIDGVAEVSWLSPDRALERFRATAGGADLLAGLEHNPLPASLEIALEPDSRTPQGVARVARALEEQAGIDELARGQQWVEAYARAVSLVRSAARVVGGVFGVAAFLIVANTIRLAVYARRDELEILSLVGASRAFVRTPFVLEGWAQGTAAGVLALALLYLAFRLLVPELDYGLALFLGNASVRFFTGAEALGMVAAGGALGVLGAVAALWRLRW